MVVLATDPVIPPGLMVQFPDGKPFNSTLPIAEAQVGWVMVPTVGAAGMTLIVAVTDVLVAVVHPFAVAST